jgi:hypothetical protein
MFEIVGESGEQGEGCLMTPAVAALASLFAVVGSFVMFNVVPEVFLWLA